jgi:hypothetical protein
LAVGLERFPPFVGQAEERARDLVHEFFLDIYVTCGFQLGHMRRQISPRQPGLVHQEHKVRAFNNVQDGQDHQPGRFVDQPVNFGDGLELCAARFSC